MSIPPKNRNVRTFSEVGISSANKKWRVAPLAMGVVFGRVVLFARALHY